MKGRSHELGAPLHSNPNWSFVIILFVIGIFDFLMYCFAVRTHSVGFVAEEGIVGDKDKGRGSVKARR